MSDVARVVPMDDALPSMRELLATPSIPAPVGEALANCTSEDIAPESGEIRYVRYRPGRDCTVLWSFPSRGRRPLLVSARLFSDDRGLLLQPFPRDHRLSGLELASSEAWVAQQLTALQLRHDGATPVVEVLPDSYKPGIRCVLRYRTEEADGHLLCLAKVARHDEPQQSVLGIGQLATRLSAARAPWGIAAPIAHVPEINLLLIEPIQDAVQVSELFDGAVHDHAARLELDEVVMQIADGLAVFQQAGFPGLPIVDPASRLVELERKASRVEPIAPELAGWLGAPLHSLRRSLAELSPEPTVLSHGSFRHEHFLRAATRLVAVDLDNLCLSGASADAGSFLSFLDTEAIADPCRRDVADSCVESFASSLSRNGCINPAWVAWYRAAGHLKWALRCFFSLSPRWPERTEALCRLATDTLAEITSSPMRTQNVDRSC